MSECPDNELRRAILISSGWLAAIAKSFTIDEATAITLRHDGAVIGEFTLGEALDIANNALESQSNEKAV